uniref:NADH-ubiquinone oxidoreductase chain 4 n=1 Tax=Grapsus tenuicrustatus TaxID=1036995 RepID=A0A140GMA1_9EUCA|nr:NADH dehydrogenase subunit 4 [Grapsus tenuicrustatus]AMN14537.1 NADH dehydrogenase subunit 4 [Grapsus tenuicrustatus]
MLKLILPLILLMKFSTDWKASQIGLGILSGLVGLSCFHNMSNYSLGFSLGLDSVSYVMIYLSAWIMFLIIISSERVKAANNFQHMFVFVNVVLLFSLFLAFSSLNYLLFYISFEMSLIPTLILILGWGYQPERIQAGIYMLFYSFLGFSLGLDSVSYVMIYLSAWIMFLIIISSERVKAANNFQHMFVFVNVVLLFSLFLAFSSLNYLLFYISFEMSLIPTLILILGWGYQPERIQAGIYMLFYTLTLSLPLLGALLYMYSSEGSLTFMLSSPISMGGYSSVILYFSSVFAFLVKLPMYMLHLWLPKAHVEAPVAGSMILAGVLLKLGGYGLIRILGLVQEISIYFSWLWVSISLMGGVMISLLCMRQVDMKSLIAYSSVVHMSMVLSGLMIFSWWGLMGAVVVMVGHGLCSSGLFCLANMVYERVGSRSLMISKGLLSFMPSMGLWWFLLSVGNMAAPPTLNLFGEISLIVSLVSWSKLSILSLILLSFFSAAYTIYMYSLSQHGSMFHGLYSCSSGKLREYMVLFLHWFPLNILITSLSLINGA